MFCSPQEFAVRKVDTNDDLLPAIKLPLSTGCSFLTISKFVSPSPLTHCPAPGPWLIQELYLQFAGHIERIYRETAFGKSYFYKVWSKHRPNIKAKMGGDFMKCNDCTLFHDTLHGSVGVRATEDSAVRAKTTMAQKAHLEVTQ